MNKLTPDQINDLVVANETADEKVFKADLKLYARMFPRSKIINDLERANEYTRKALDGRMLKEMLKEICITTIHENRLKLTMKATKTDKTNTPPPPDSANNDVSDKLQAARNELLAIEDITKMKYNVCKSLLLRLGLKVAKADRATIVAALIAHKQQLLDAMPKAETIVNESGNDADADANANESGNDADADANANESGNDADAGSDANADESGNDAGAGAEGEKKSEGQE